ncbi:MAG: hypothetical protein PUA63_01940 [Oscillospiraceae bacterium]|nr:hypothetical protein [Oscillospiraceae bacterium]
MNVKGGARIRHIIVLPDGSELSSGSIGADALQEVTLTESLSADPPEDAELEPGGASTACLEFSVLTNGSARLMTAGTEFDLYREEDGARTLLGHFTAEKPVKSGRSAYKTTAWDNVTKLDKNLSPWLYDNQSAFPMPLLDFAKAVCAQCGVTLLCDDLPNAGFSVSAFYADDLTGLLLMQWVGQAAGRFLRARPDGQLEFSWYADRTTQAGAAPRDSRTVTLLAAQPDGKILQASGGKFLALKDNFGIAYPYAMDGLSFEDYETAPPDKVQIRQSDSDIGVIYPPDATGTNTYVIQGNMLLASASAAALEPVAASLYTLLRGITYTPAKIKLLARDVIHPGDIVRVRDASGRVFTTAVMTRTASGGCDTLESTGSPSRDSVSAVNRKGYKNLQGKMLEIAADIDGLNIKASELSGNYSALEQKVDGFTLTVTNGDSTSTLKLKSGSTELSSAEIKFSGMVTISNLKTAGSSVINGSNITTGTIANADRSALFDLDGKRFRMGTSSGDRVLITKSGIEWYGGNSYSSTASAQGIIKNGLTTGATGDTCVIGADTRYQKYGWYHDGEFSGITVEQIDKEVAVPNLLSVGGKVSCRALSAWESKERIVPTVFGNIGMEALETPQPTFADWGEGVCNEDGLCLAVPDARFAETVSASQRPAWIVTDRSGEGSLWAQDYADSALIHGKPGQRFAWLCLNAQRGFEGQYAVLSDAKEPSSEDGDWLLCYTGDLAQQEEKNLEELLLKEAET